MWEFDLNRAIIVGIVLIYWLSYKYAFGSSPTDFQSPEESERRERRISIIKNFLVEIGASIRTTIKANKKKKQAESLAKNIKKKVTKRRVSLDLRKKFFRTALLAIIAITLVFACIWFYSANLWGLEKYWRHLFVISFMSFLIALISSSMLPNLSERLGISSFSLFIFTICVLFLSKTLPKLEFLEGISGMICVIGIIFAVPLGVMCGFGVLFGLFGEG